MKIKFKKEDFTKALDFCSTSIEKKHAMPILSNILLEVKDGKCKFISTNLDTSVIVKVNPTELEGEGSLAMPAKYVFDICKVTRGESIALDYDKEHNLLNITAEKSKYQIPCAEKNDFPNVVEEAGDEKKANIGKLIALYKKLQFSMTDASINKAYSGVLIIRPKGGDKRIEMVTTDIHRISVLSLNDFSVDLKEFEDGIVISGKNFSEIGKIFSEKEEVGMWIIDGKLTIKSETVTFISRLIKNEFPNYKTVTGSFESLEAKDHAAVNRKELVSGIKRVIALNTDEKIWATKLEFKGNVLTMNASSEFGGNSSDEVLVEKPFNDNKSIGINARYLIDVLSVLDVDNTSIIVEEGLRPLTIIEKTENYYYIHMVMPLRI